MRNKSNTMFKLITPLVLTVVKYFRVNAKSETKKASVPTN